MKRRLEEAWTGRQWLTLLAIVISGIAALWAKLVPLALGLIARAI